jgi:Zn-dependent membrane protease YugP
MMFGLMIFDQWWWLMIPGLLLGLYAQLKVNSAYNQYVRVPADSGWTGAQTAREILDRAGLQNVPVGEVPGHLTDHYDPIKKALFLSSDNFHGHSLAALGISAHESGHALQHKAAYAPMQIRQTIAPVAGFATNAAMWITFGGYFAGLPFLRSIIGIAIAVFGVVALFHLITLPVEFDASRRAKEQLLKLGLIDGREERGVSRVLNAAALTYVAAMISSLFTLLHLIMIARGQDRD